MMWHEQFGEQSVYLQTFWEWHQPLVSYDGDDWWYPRWSSEFTHKLLGVAWASLTIEVGSGLLHIQGDVRVHVLLRGGWHGYLFGQHPPCRWCSTFPSWCQQRIHSLEGENDGELVPGVRGSPEHHQSLQGLWFIRSILSSFKPKRKTNVICWDTLGLLVAYVPDVIPRFWIGLWKVTLQSFHWWHWSYLSSK